MSPDKICADYAERGAKLTVEMLDGDTVLIKGNREALEFLADLLRAQAHAADDGFQISPNGAGSSLFASGSKYGLYVLRLE